MDGECCAWRENEPLALLEVVTLKKLLYVVVTVWVVCLKKKKREQAASEGSSVAVWFS